MLPSKCQSSGKWGIYNPDEIPEVDEKRRSSLANSIIQLTPISILNEKKYKMWSRNTV